MMPVQHPDMEWKMFAGTSNPSLAALLFIAAILCFYPAAGVRAADNGNSNAEFTLGAGDSINVFVWKDPSLSRTVAVRPDGKINYPLVGEIQAKGRTLRDIEAALSAGLKNYLKQPIVNVILEDAASHTVYVLGEVTKSGVYRLGSSMTVLQAIALAGGFTPFADRNKVTIIDASTTGALPPPDQRKIFNYGKFIDGKVGNIVLQPGDTVLVP
ncbi:MAG TPA: polysaccharide export protein [Thiolapillus brandeum]|uniref:Polysaccharide export protein n=1 Tax=Thiolapillus brandeum TaxID=1076588 RepID=A0A831RZQ9_9GAMM|nr:polysaccharide export protein [Thiolapillus brandeum]